MDDSRFILNSDQLCSGHIAPGGYIFPESLVGGGYQKTVTCIYLSIMFFQLHDRTGALKTAGINPDGLL